MKKLIVSFVLVTLLLSIAGIGMVAASKPNHTPAKNPEYEFSLPENAVEVSPGVFYLGESQDVDGKPVKGYAFVHYTKGYEPDVLETGDSTYDTSTCYSFIWEDIKWNPENVEDYVIYPENRRGLDPNSILTTFGTSVSTWEFAGQTSEQYNIIGTGSLVEEKITRKRLDGINMVRFGNLPGNIIAMNIIWSNGINLVEWDQIYDDKDFDWSLDCETEDCTTKMDLQNIATHELGHAVGLGDLYSDACNNQTMYGYSTEGDTKKRTLESGDIAGLNILYG